MTILGRNFLLDEEGKLRIVTRKVIPSKASKMGNIMVSCGQVIRPHFGFHLALRKAKWEMRLTVPG